MYLYIVCHTDLSVYYGTCQKKVAKHANTLRIARILRSRYSHTNVREVHEMRTTMVAVRIRIGIYTVRELRDNTVANFMIIQSQTS